MTPEQRAHQSARAKAWRALHPDRVKALYAKHHPLDKDRANERRRARRTTPAGHTSHLEYNRAWRDRHAVRVRIYDREAALKRKYGLSIADVDAMLSAQGFACAICQCALLNDAKTHVDHCHSTGRVRGLLCHACNTAIGLFRDDPSRLASAIRYLAPVLKAVSK